VSRYEYRREPLTSDEMVSLANACRTGDERLAVYTLLDLGLRVSEFCNITKDQIDWQLHRLTFRGKRNKRRVLQMQGRTRDLLESYISTNDSIQMSVRTVQRIIRRVANRAKIRRPCSPHVLRHSFACDALRKGVTLPTLMKILGHEDLATTQIYANMSPEDVLREMASKL
jgi:integrase/recombinase XerD